MTRTRMIFKTNYQFMSTLWGVGVLICLTLCASATVAQLTVNTSFNAGVTDGNSTGLVSAVQPDGKILVGGNHAFANGTEQFGLSRLNTNGTIDTTWNIGGLGPNGRVFDIKILGDGKIIIGGDFSTYNGTSIAGLARLNSNGTLDTTFNTGGAGTVGVVQGITIQPDGKYLITGGLSSYNATAKFSIIRVNVDGTLDTTFTSPFTTAQFVEQCGLQTDGKIIIGGAFSINGSFGIARLTTTGAADATFNVGGSGTNDNVYAVYVLPDNRILAGGGFTSFNGIARQGGMRLLSTGALDTTFVPPSGLDFSSAEYVAVKPNGQYVVAGAFVDIDGNFPITLLNTDGTIDATFTPPQADGSGYHVNLQPDGKILLAGWFNNVETLGNLSHRNLVRLNADGTVDTGFNCAFNTFGSVGAMIQQPDGKYVVAGNFNSANSVNHVNVTRFNADGTIDNTFQSGYGLFSTGFVAANALARQADGKILLGGIFGSYNLNDAPSLVRLNTDGTRDTTFSAIGIGAGFPQVNDLLVLPDGKIMVGGTGLDIGFQNLVRLNADGSGDGTFAPGNANGATQKILRQADGKLIVVGNFNSYGGGTRNRIVRLNTDGTVDGTYNVGTGTNGTIAAAVFQSDGKLVIGGTFTTFNGTSRNRIARLNADGSLDTTFTTTAGGANGSVTSIAIQPDGKIVIGGGLTTYDGVARVRLARINADGTLDSSATTGIENNFRFGVRRLLATADNEILVGGQFVSYGGTSRFSLAKLRSTTRKPLFDFDGDGKDDVSVYRNGIWYLLRSQLGFSAVNWGLATDKTVAGDYDGDGKADTAVFRNGAWIILNSSNGAVSIVNWGQTGDIPMVGDYDGDNKTDLTVFRGGNWYILQSSNGGFTATGWGLATDKPVVGKFDADNKSDIAVFRNGNWYILGSLSGFSSVGWGQTGDVPVPGDYDGDGRTDVAVFRGGNWYVLRSTAGFQAVGWGLGTDTAVPADYDGDGKTDVAVFRDGNWYILQSSNGAFSAVGFGIAGDKPIPAQLQ